MEPTERDVLGDVRAVKEALSLGITCLKRRADVLGFLSSSRDSRTGRTETGRGWSVSSSDLKGSKTWFTAHGGLMVEGAGGG
jgi:hypothetical protein